MASISSIRSKQWREKRKDDEEFRERERQRKRKARQSRSDEKKGHDRELSKKRQKRFRERKKSNKCDVPSSQVFTTVNDDEENASGISDNVKSPTEDGFLTVLDSNTSGAITYNNFDKVTEDVVCVSDEMEDESGPVYLCNVSGNSWNENRKRSTNQFDDEAIENRMDTGASASEGREAYFERIQATLSQIEDFPSLQRECNQLSHQIEQLYPIGDLPTLDVEEYQLDNVASSMYPHEDAPNDFVPIRTLGDGNCLPRVGSLFAFGTDKQHCEIRVRIFIELCLYEQNYLDDSYLERGAENRIAKIAENLALFSDVHFPKGNNGVALAFHQYVKNILKKNSFNGMWSIYALASVLGVQVSSIYPSYSGHNVRPYLHRLIMPRVFRQEKNKTIHVMWTNTGGKQQKPVAWKPDHFVAVLPTDRKTRAMKGSPGMSKEIEQSESQLFTGSFSVTGSLSSNSDPPVESPTTHFLNTICNQDANVDPYGKTHPTSTGLAPPDHTETKHSVPVKHPTVSRSDGQNDLIEHGTMDPRSKDRCHSHPEEQLVYLCMTCDELPICYKCHLNSHLQHKFEDLKLCLPDKERIYLQKITRKQEDLKNEIKQQKQSNAEHMKWIESKIEETFKYYQELLDKWKHRMLEKKSKGNQRVIEYIQKLESQLKSIEVSEACARHFLNLLPVSKRLAVLKTEPQSEDVLERQPRAQVVFRAGPDISLDQFGTLTEIPYPAESPSTSVSIHTAKWSEMLRDTGTNVNQSLCNGTRDDDGQQTRTLTTDPDQEISGGSTVSTFQDPTHKYYTESAIQEKSVNTFPTTAFKNPAPLMSHGLQDDRTGPYLQMADQKDITTSYFRSVLPSSNHQPLNKDSTLLTHDYQQQQSAKSTLTSQNHKPMNSDVHTMPVFKDQSFIAGLQTNPTTILKPLGSGTLAQAIGNDKLQLHDAIDVANNDYQLSFLQSTAGACYNNEQRETASNNQMSTYMAPPESLRKDFGFQPSHRHQGELAMLRVEDSSVALLNDLASNKSILRHKGLTTSSATVFETRMPTTKNQTPLRVDDGEGIGDKVSLMPSGNSNTDGLEERSNGIYQFGILEPDSTEVKRRFKSPYKTPLKVERRDTNSWTSGEGSTTTNQICTWESDSSEVSIRKRTRLPHTINPPYQKHLRVERREGVGGYAKQMPSDDSDTDSWVSCDGSTETNQIDLPYTCTTNLSSPGRGYAIPSVTIPLLFVRIFFGSKIRSVGNVLYFWNYFSTNVLCISKEDGVTHVKTLNGQNGMLVPDFCVSGIDNSLWFLYEDGKVIRQTSTGTMETKFTVSKKGYLMSICITSTGYVLVGSGKTLKLYTENGEVVNSTEHHYCFRGIRECSLKRNILVWESFLENVLTLYDHELHRKFIIKKETVTYPDGHTRGFRSDISLLNDACFDKQGNILVCNEWKDILLIDHTNGLFLRTILSDYRNIYSLDVDNEGVMWVLQVKVDGSQQLVGFTL